MYRNNKLECKSIYNMFDFLINTFKIKIFMSREILFIK